MKKILLLLFIVSNQVFAQFNISSFSTPAQQLVQDAISDGVYVIKQSYQIKEKSSGRMFGVDGKSEFGTSYSIALKATRGFYVYDVAARPWVYDNSFKQLEQGKYIPVLSSSSVYKVKSKGDFEAVQTDTIVSLNNELIYRVDVHHPDSTGFSILKTTGELTGWVVLLTTERDARLAEKPEISYSIYRREITIGNDTVIPFDAAQDTRNVIGGFFIVPENTGIGQITFRLAGLIEEKETGWMIALIHEANITPTEQTPVSAETSKNLTPLNGGEDNNAKDSEESSKRGKGKDKKKK